MAEGSDFDKLLSQVMACTPQQAKKLEQVLKSKMGAKEYGTRDYSSGSPTQATYDHIRYVMEHRCGVHLPASLGKIRKFEPWVVDKLTVVAHEIDALMAREFKGCSRVELDAVRGLIVGAAVNSAASSAAMLSGVTPTLNGVLAALLVPEQVLDSEYPGYRQRGVLREMFLRHIHRMTAKGQEYVRHKPDKT